MKKRTLEFKLVAGGILIVLIPLLVTGIFTSLKSSTALVSASMEQSELVAKSLANMVQLVLQEEMKVASHLASNNTVIEAVAGAARKGLDGAVGETSRATATLDELMKKSGNDYENIVVADSHGKVVSSTRGGKLKGLNVSEEPYFKQAKSTGKTTTPEIHKSIVTGNPIAPIGAPIYSSSGEFLGVVGCVPNISFLNEKIGATKIGKTGFAYMIDQNGFVIAHPKTEYILELNLAKQPGMEEIGTKMLARKSAAQGYTFQGIKKVAGYAPVELTGWSIAVTQDEDELLSSANAIKKFIILITLVFLVLVVFLVLYFSRTISLPIKMAVKNLNDSADQIASASMQVSSASQSLAEGASEQASAIEETSSSLEEMSSMTKQNAGNAGQADSLMKQANQIVHRANQSMTLLTDSMQKISEASDETSKIIKTIDDVAFQTNLLALNAAVEAARAGEAGAGFAVVAEEVRNLAMRAAEAARNTSELIEGTVKKVKEGSDLVVMTNDAFAEVAKSSEKVAGLVGEISAASNEQAQGIDQVNKAVAEMDKVTQQTAANAEESASASEELNAQAQQMKNISNELADIIGIGNDLNTSNAGEVQAVAVQTPRRGVLKRISAMPIGKHIVVGSLSKKKGREIRPDHIIPFENDEFKDL